MSRGIWIAFALASLGWGIGNPIIRVVLDTGATAFEVSVYRAAIAAIVVLAYLGVRRSLRPGVIAWKVGIVMAITNLAAPYLLTTVALQYASAGFVGLPAALIPLLTAAMAHVFLPGDRLSLAKVLGLALAMAGVVVLLTSGDSGLSEAGRPLLAGLLGLGSAVSIAVGSIYAKHHAGAYGTLEVIGLQFGMGAVGLAVASVVAEGVPAVPTAAAWAWLVVLGIFTTVVPFAAYYWLIRRVTATFASTIGYLVPLVTIVVGIVALDERLQAGIVLGGLLIIAGVGVTDRLEARVRRLEARRGGE